MSLVALCMLAVGLAMDAFAVSICKGLAMKKITLKKALIVGAWFGIFQGLMPIIGYFIGSQLEEQMSAIDHWIAFALLGFIGINMIRESRSWDDEAGESLAVKEMFILAIATSIDALAVGVTLAFLQVDIILAVSIIGIITFIVCMIGVKIGNVFGVIYKSRAEMAGGIVLILMGMKILLEHLNIF